MSHIYYIMLLVVFFVRGYGGEVPFTKCWPTVKFSCQRKGPQLLFHVTLPTIILQTIQNTEMKCTKTMIIKRPISILSFTFVLRWEGNVHFIWLLIANNTTYLKFLFLNSFLPPELICDSPYCRGMRYHLHVRGHIRLTNYHFYTHVESVSLFTTIFVILTKTDMWKVQHCTILDGLEYPILSRKGFVKVTPIAGRVSSTFLLPTELILCPPYARGLRYHQPFRGHVRLTNDNFHVHVHHCIAIHYHRYSIHRLMTCHADLQ